MNAVLAKELATASAGARRPLAHEAIPRAIEDAGLDEPLVTALLDGKRVIGGRDEVREVKNAIAAYDRVASLDPGDVNDFLVAHEMSMSALVADAGELRRGGVGIVQGGRVGHVAPPASRVPHVVTDLLDFVRRDAEIHPLVKSALCHYEIEFIHPTASRDLRAGVERGVLTRRGDKATARDLFAPSRSRRR